MDQIVTANTMKTVPYSNNAATAEPLPTSNNYYFHDEPLSFTMSTLNGVENYMGNAIDILNCVDTLLQDDDDADGDDQELEPTPISTDSGRMKVVSRVTLQEDPTFGFNDDIRRDVINVLLSKQQPLRKLKNSSSITTTMNKRSRDIPSTIEILQQPLSKKPRRVSQQLPAAADVISGVDQDAAEQSKTQQRFRAYQAEQWSDRLQDMIAFKRSFGHCCVPNTFPPNPNLAQWVKRQRYQYKLKHEGKHSTLTDEREATLQDMGFIWDSHGAAWLERWNELAKFRAEKGHSNVPTNYPENRQLAIWVKCQRRQYKLYASGSRSNMTPERVNKLESLDFVWNPRGMTSTTTTNSSTRDAAAAATTTTTKSTTAS